ncbi:MAG TPA: hypothetical protein VGG25_27055 [Streptosporangiaceae bacterium]|jgi:DNA-binding transcriptional regulator LsrR (DeoR family)
MTRQSAAVDVAALARAYEQGASLRRCGTEFGISAPVVARLLREQQVTIRPAHGRRVRADPAEIARAYQAGQTLTQCAAAHAISPPTVARLLRVAGVTPREAHRRRAEVDPADLARAYQDHGLAACAAKFGISARVVRRLLVAQGVQIRPSGVHIQSALPVVTPISETCMCSRPGGGLR